LKQRRTDGGDFAHCPEVTGRAPCGEQSAVHARHPDGIETGSAQRGHNLPVHRTREHHLNDLGNLRGRHAHPVAFLNGELETPAHFRYRLSATMDDYERVNRREGTGTFLEPSRPIELVAADLRDARS
jgi:hypothetical protein